MKRIATKWWQNMTFPYISFWVNKIVGNKMYDNISSTDPKPFQAVEENGERLWLPMNSGKENIVELEARGYSKGSSTYLSFLGLRS